MSKIVKFSLLISFYINIYVLGTQKNRLIETVLLSTHNKYMFWLRNKKIIFLLLTLNQKLVNNKISQKFTTDLMLFVVCLI